MTSWGGVQTKPKINITNTVTSIVCNFKSTRVAIGSHDNGTNGIVNVYDYVEASNTWVQIGESLTGEAGSYFGHSIDMDWNGKTLVIGAWGTSKVYIYRECLTCTQPWVLTLNDTISGAEGTDFGFCVSIRKDIPDTIAISAPSVNNVFVYENVSDVWQQSFKDNGDSIENIIPINTSGLKYVTLPQFNRYGESLRLSSFGKYLIVGQPGTVLDVLNSTNTKNFPVGDSLNVDSLVKSANGEYISSFGVNQNRQQGSARVFRTDSTWNLSNVQVGSLLEPDVSCVTDDRERTDYAVGWSFPGFGMQVDISSEGDFVVVSAPLFSVKGGDYTYHNGQIYTFLYVNGVWVKQDVFTGFKQSMFGKSIKLDYTGERIAISGSNKRFSILNVSDWNGKSWYGAQPDIFLSLNGSYSNFDNKIYITSGEIIPRSIGGETSFFDYLLTQSILGNNLVRGYLAADEIFVGANDNDNDPSQKYSNTKRISFGGTYLDNTYEGATIENRMYKLYTPSTGQGNEGRSELLIAKTTEKVGTSESGGVDLIRLKAHEIHLDSHSLYSDYDNKYVNNPTFVLNYQKNVSIGLPFLDDNSGRNFGDIGGRTDKFFRGTANAKAKLDVNGSVYVRNRLNLNVDGGNDILGNIGEQPRIFFDTRNGGSVIDNIISSNTLVQFQLINIQGIINDPASYSAIERAFDFTQGGNVTTYWERDSSNFRVSLWVKLTNLPGSDNILFRWAYSNGSNPVDIYATTTGFKVIVETYIYTTSFTFTINKWEHIVIEYVSPSTFNVFINGQQPGVYQVSGNLPSLQRPSVVTIGGGSNMYIGMVMIWSGRSNNGPTPLMMYNNGPPSEMLKVGGDAVVTGKLGMGVTNPTEALEVSGNVYIDGEQSGFVVDAQGNKRVGLMKYVGYGGALVHGSGQRLDIGRSDTADVTTATTFTPEITVSTSGNVGVGTTNPQNTLTVDSNDPVLKSATSTPDTSFNYILNAPRPGNTSGGAVHFINGTNRADDGGTNTYTIRNDSGPLRLGNDLYQTTVTGSSVQTRVGYIHRTISLRDANSGYTDLGSGVGLNLGTLQSGVTGSFNSPMIQRGIQSNFTSGDGALWEGNRIIVGFRYVALGTGLTGSVNSFRVYSNNYQTTTTTNYDWTASDDGFDRGFMSTTSPPVISHTGDVPSIWLVNISAHSVRINAVWVEYVNI